MNKTPPIIIVSAGRSGSKLLRAILGSHPDVGHFPREINYIWRHGNAFYPSDELRPDHARPDVARYIQRRFEDFKNKHHINYLVEKTCANALRVAFVHHIFPDAIIIHLIRDGRAVAESARRRWQAPPDLRYLLEKARWLPWRDVPYYGLRYLRYQLQRVGNDTRSPSSWGPRFAGIDEAVRNFSLIEVCGLQWKACVTAANESFKLLPPSQAITLRYEDLIQSPLDVSARLFQQVGLAMTPPTEAYLKRELVTDNVDKWQRQLSDADLARLLPHIEDELLANGYRL